MVRQEIKELLDKVEKIFAAEANLIELQSGRVIFVGDTHGDFEATERIFQEYFKAGNTLVFLGDYVDRGPASRENINFLLQQKIEHPESLFLLMGNHEGYAVASFHPADFWETLDGELLQRYSEVLSKLPLAASTSNGILALHGALPDVPELANINNIKLGSTEWHQVTWGDWQEAEGGFGRPQFGQAWFKDIMSRLGKNVLIRSHQPDATPVMYNKRCLTIFTSSAYKHYVQSRTIAVADLERPMETVDDITIGTV